MIGVQENGTEGDPRPGHGPVVRRGSANSQDAAKANGSRTRRVWQWFRKLPALVQVAANLAAIAGVYLTAAAIACWSPFQCPSEIRIDTDSSRFNPPGDDDPSAEFVCLVNEEDEAVELVAWTLRDAEGDVNVLPDFALAAGARVRVHPGRGADTTSDLYGSEGASAWNNEGDSATLLDANGEEVDSRAYGSIGEQDAGECAPSVGG